MEAREPPLLYGRLIFVGFLTVWTGSLSVLLGLGALTGDNPVVAVGVSLTYGLVASLIVTALLTVPMYLVWVVAFASFVQRWPEVRKRATFASGICAAIGALGMIVLLGTNPDVDWKQLLFLAPFAMVPIGVGALLTWRAFSPSRYRS